MGGIKVWRDVDDSLPDEGQEVFVINAKQRSFGDSPRLGMCINGEWQTVYASFPIDGVTHWSVIPREDQGEGSERGCEDSSDWSIVQIMRDGSQWCALYGPDLVVGVGGFGDDPIDALVDLIATIRGSKRMLGRSPFLDFALKNQTPASIGGE